MDPTPIYPCQTGKKAPKKGQKSATKEIAIKLTHFDQRTPLFNCTDQTEASLNEYKCGRG
jgi:hypothetical protein